MAIADDQSHREQFRVLESSLDSVYVVRATPPNAGIESSFIVEYANERATDVAGRPMAELIGLPFSVAYPEAIDMGLDQKFRDVVRTGQPFEDANLTYSAEVDGVVSTGCFHLQATKFEDSVVVSFRNVTEQRDQELQWMTERVQAEAVQWAFIPKELPSFAGLQVAAAYVPARGARLGGDWFDTFLVDDTVVMIVGDVAGHGIHSAAVMGQFRNAARAFAFEEPIAEQIVSRLNRLLCRANPGELASVVVAVWNPLTGVLSRSSAGHPPVLRCRMDETEFLESLPEPIMGIDADRDYRATDKVLRSGTTLLFYSDGLIESRSLSIVDGMVALREAADPMCELHPQEICDSLVAWKTSSERLEDDLCILAVRLG